MSAKDESLIHVCIKKRLRKTLHMKNLEEIALSGTKYVCVLLAYFKKRNFQ